MSRRASRSPASCQTRGSARAARAMPSRHSASVSGLRARADERLDELRQCVQTGARGDVRRQRVSQFGIHDREPRQHQGAAQARLHACSAKRSTALRVTSAPVPAVVGTAMKGREARSERPPAAHDFQVVERLTAVGRQRRDGLAAIDRAAAADRDHHVAAGLAALRGRRRGRPPLWARRRRRK